MLEPGGMDEIRRKLAELEELDSVSPFSRTYYGLIAGRLESEDQQSAGLRCGFAAHLDRELRYHWLLRNLACKESVEIGDMVSLTDKRGVGLRDTIEILGSAQTTSDGQEATRNLIVAECHYHLALFEHVVGDLERAVTLGADDPLVHFALGYNRYMLAERAFTAADPGTGLPVVVDLRNYRCIMLDAVSAFEEALTGGHGDPQLYWWIGTCLERAGFREAARDAFNQADDLDEDAGADGESTDGEETCVDDLSGISIEEIWNVGELLKRSYSAGEVMGEDGSV